MGGEGDSYSSFPHPPPPPIPTKIQGYIYIMEGWGELYIYPTCTHTQIFKGIYTCACGGDGELEKKGRRWEGKSFKREIECEKEGVGPKVGMATKLFGHFLLAEK